MAADCVTHRARVLLTQRWAREQPHLFFASVHPGWVETDGLKNAQAMSSFYALMRPSLRSAAAGADTVAWLCSKQARTKISSGAYCWDRARRSIDLPFSGTRAREADVDELVAYLQHAVI